MELYYFGIRIQKKEHHKPCFNLFILCNNLFDNQGNEINKNNIFYAFQHNVFHENFLYICIHVNYLPSVLIYVLPFKVQSSTETKLKPFNCTKFIIGSVKGFRLVREMPEYTIEVSK